MRLVSTTEPARRGHDEHGHVLGWDLADGDSVLVALVGGPVGDAKPYDTREGVALRVRPAAGATIRVEAHMGERVDGQLWPDGWVPVTFARTGTGETDEAAGIVVNTAQACALRISAAGGAGSAAVRFGAEPQRGYQG